MAEIHVDDIGTQFKLTVKDETDTVVPLGSATCVIQFSKPDNTLLTKSATVISAGSGIMGYTTASGDIDQAGEWQIQGTIALSGSVWNTEIHEFRVHENI